MASKKTLAALSALAKEEDGATPFSDILSVDVAKIEYGQLAYG